MLYVSINYRGNGASGAQDGGPQGCLCRGGTMNDVADGLLLDVEETGIADLESAEFGSALDIALERILKSHSGCNFNSFGSSI